jgi:hypothetical protein
VALWCLFFQTLLSTKDVCSKTVGATCAAGSSARHSHRIFACMCRNRTSARAPRPESTASRAEHIVGEEKVRIFLFWNTCSFSQKYTFAHKMIGERAGDERSFWPRNPTNVGRILFKKSIYFIEKVYTFAKKYTSEIRQILDVRIESPSLT